jgi:hypothetical protein
MSQPEADPSTRWPLSKYLKVGFALAGLGYFPLQLYILFGPRDGNPIGLGLGFVLGLGAGVAVVAVGLVKGLLQYLEHRPG